MSLKGKCCSIWGMQLHKKITYTHTERGFGLYIMIMQELQSNVKN